MTTIPTAGRSHKRIHEEVMRFGSEPSMKGKRPNLDLDMFERVCIPDEVRPNNGVETHGPGYYEIMSEPRTVPELSTKSIYQMTAMERKVEQYKMKIINAHIELWAPDTIYNWHMSEDSIAALINQVEFIVSDDLVKKYLENLATPASIYEAARNQMYMAIGKWDVAEKFGVYFDILSSNSKIFSKPGQIAGHASMLMSAMTATREQSFAVQLERYRYIRKMNYTVQITFDRGKVDPDKVFRCSNLKMQKRQGGHIIHDRLNKLNNKTLSVKESWNIREAWRSTGSKPCPVFTSQPMIGTVLAVSGEGPTYATMTDVLDMTVGEIINYLRNCRYGTNTCYITEKMHSFFLDPFENILAGNKLDSTAVLHGEGRKWGCPYLSDICYRHLKKEGSNINDIVLKAIDGCENVDSVAGVLYLEKGKRKLRLFTNDTTSADLKKQGVKLCRCGECKCMNAIVSCDNMGCGVCGSDLGRVVSAIGHIDINDWYAEWCTPNIGGQLDKLGLLNFLDGAVDEDENRELYAKLIDHDLAIVRRVLSRADVDSLRLREGMTRDEFSILASKTHDRELHTDEMEAVAHAMYCNEITILENKVIDCLPSGVTKVRLGDSCLPNCYLDETNPTVCCQKIIPGTHVNNSEKMNLLCTHNIRECTCFDKATDCMYGLDGICNLSMGDVLDSMKEQGQHSLLFTCPNIPDLGLKKSGILAHEQGSWVTHLDKTHVMLIGMDRPLTFDYNELHNWAMSDSFYMQDNYGNIKTLMTVGNHKVRCLTIDTEPRYANDFSNILDKGGDEIEIVCPKIQTIQPVGMQSKLVVADAKIKLRLKLLHKLNARNLGGSLSYKALLDYAISVAHARYSIHDRVITYSNLTAEDVENHTVVSMLLMSRRASRVGDVKWIVENDAPVSILKKLGIMGGEWLLSGIVKCLGGLGNQFQVKEALSTIDSHTAMQINTWATSKVWDSLESMLSGPQFHSRIVNYSWADRKTEIGNFNVCNHHKSSCNHPVLADSESMCKCCNLVNATKNRRCACCDVEAGCRHQCDHVCSELPHTCHGGCDHEKRQCSCCMKEHCGTLCPPCSGERSVINPLELECSLAEIEHVGDKLVKVPKARRYVTKGKFVQERTEQGPRGRTRGRDAAANRMTWFDRVLNIQMVDQEKSNEKGKEQETSEGASEEKGKPEAFGLGSSKRYKLRSGQKLYTEEGPKPESQYGKRPESEEEIREKLMQMRNLRMRLAFCTSERYVEVLEKGWPTVNATTSAEWHGNQKLTYSVMLPMVNQGDTYVPADWIEPTVIKPDAVTATTTRLCGLQAIIDSVCPGTSIVTLMTISGLDGDLSTVDILRTCSAIKGNVVVIAGQKCNIGKNDPWSDEYGVIVHSRVLGKDFDHWYSAAGRMTDKYNLYPVFDNRGRNIDRAEEYGSKGYKFSPDRWMHTPIMLRLSVELMMCGELSLEKILISGENFIPRVVQRGSTTYLCNNFEFTDDIRNGLLSIPIPNVTVPQLSLLADCTPRDKSALVFDEYLDMSLADEFNVEKAIKSTVDECVKDMIDIDLACRGLIDMAGKFKDRVYTIKLRQTQSGHCVIEGLPVNMKSLDMVQVTTKKGMRHRLHLVKIGKSMCIRSDTKLATEVSLQCRIPKSSYSSQMRMLHACLTSNVSEETITRQMKNAVAVYGVPGSGKSTEILASADDKTTIITMTKSAKDRLLDAEKSGAKVLTLEQAYIEKVRTTKLVVDEATMITWLTILWCLTDDIKYVKLYGDVSQIGVVDMRKTAGKREWRSIMELANISERRTTTYRIGKTLATQLQHVIPDLQTRAPHDTAVRLHTAEWNNKDTIVKLLNTYDVDVILTHYQTVKTALEDMILMNIPVETTHSYQGKEANVVMFIQYSPTRTAHSLIYNKEYNVSAATRAKKMLIWVSVDCFDDADPLYTRIIGGYVGGVVITQIGEPSDVDTFERASKSMISNPGIIFTYAKSLLTNWWFKDTKRITDVEDTTRASVLQSTLKDFSSIREMADARLNQSGLTIVENVWADHYNRVRGTHFGVPIEVEFDHKRALYRVITNLPLGMNNLLYGKIESVISEVTGVRYSRTNIDLSSGTPALLLGPGPADNAKPGSILASITKRVTTGVTQAAETACKSVKQCSELCVCSSSWPDDSPKVNVSHCATTKVVMTGRSLTRLRILSHIVSGLTSASPTMTLDGPAHTELNITRTGGCTYCSDLLFSVNNEPILYVTSMYKQWWFRTIYYDEDQAFTPIVTCILSWFGARDVENRLLIDDHNCTWSPIPGVNFDDRSFEYGMFMDRLNAGKNSITDLIEKSIVGEHTTWAWCNQYDQFNEAHLKINYDKAREIFGNVVASPKRITGSVDGRFCPVMVLLGSYPCLALMEYSPPVVWSVDTKKIPVSDKYWVVRELATFVNHMLDIDRQRASWQFGKTLHCAGEKLEEIILRHCPEISKAPLTIGGIVDIKEIEGLMIPPDVHVERNTAVIKAINKKKNAIILKQLREHKMRIFATKNQIDKYRRDVGASLPNAIVNRHGSVNLDDGFDNLVDTIVTAVLCRKANKDATQLYVTDWPSLVVTNTMTNCTAWPTTISKTNERYLGNINYARSGLNKLGHMIDHWDAYMLDDHDAKQEKVIVTRKRLSELHKLQTDSKGVGPWFVNEASKELEVGKRDQLWIGPGGLKNTLGTLLSLIVDCAAEKTICWAPDICYLRHSALISSPNFPKATSLRGGASDLMSRRPGEGNYEFFYDDATYPTEINRELFDWLSCGQCKNREVKGDTYTVWAQKSTCILGHNVYEIYMVKATPGSSFTSYCCNQDIYMSNKLLTYRLPMFAENLVSALETEELVSTVELVVDEKMFRSLSLKALREETTYDDIIQYARTLLNATYYSDRGTWQQYKIDQDVALNTAVCAYYEGKKIGEGMDTMLKWCSLKSGETVKGQQMIERTLAKLKDTVLATYSSLMSAVNVPVATQQLYDSLIKACKDMPTAQAVLSHFQKVCRKCKIERVDNHQKLVIYHAEGQVTQTCHEEESELWNFRGPVLTAFDYVSNQLAEWNSNVMHSAGETVKKIAPILKNMIPPQDTSIGKETESCKWEDRVRPSEQKRIWRCLPREGESDKTSLKPIYWIVIGSRGDVEPCLRYAREMLDEGLKVMMVTHYTHGLLCGAYKVPFKGIGGDPGKMILNAIKLPSDPLGAIKAGKDLMHSYIPKWLTSIALICKEAGVIMEAAYPGYGRDVAEWLNVPYVRVSPFPWTETNHWQFQKWEEPSTNHALNLTSYRMFNAGVFSVEEPYVNEWRVNTLHLAPRSTNSVTSSDAIDLLMCCDDLLPRAPDWHDCVRTIGYPHINNSGSEPDASTISWLEVLPAGRTNAVLTFGSMTDPNVVEFLLESANSLLEAGCRVLILLNWAAKLIDNMSDDRLQLRRGLVMRQGVVSKNLLVAKSFPFTELRNLVHIAVVHGGSGTAHGMACIGAYTIFKPYLPDQKQWGLAYRRLGIGDVCDTNDPKKFGRFVFETVINVTPRIDQILSSVVFANIRSKCKRAKMMEALAGLIDTGVIVLGSDEISESDKFFDAEDEFATETKITELQEEIRQEEGSMSHDSGSVRSVMSDDEYTSEEEDQPRTVFVSDNEKGLSLKDLDIQGLRFRPIYFQTSTGISWTNGAIARQELGAGLVELTLSTGVDLYDPTTVGECVVKSFLYHMESGQIKSHLISYFNLIGVATWSPLNTVFLIAEICNVQVLVKVDGRGYGYTPELSSSCIGLTVTTSPDGKRRHCKCTGYSIERHKGITRVVPETVKSHVLTLRVSTEGGRRVERLSHDPERFLSLSNTVLENLNISSSVIYGLINYESSRRFLSENKIDYKDWEAKVNSKHYVKTVTTPNHLNLTLRGHRVDNGICVPGNKLQPGRVYLAITSGGLVAGLCIQDDKDQILVGDYENLAYLGGVINTRMVIPGIQVKGRREVSTKEESVSALNEESLIEAQRFNLIRGHVPIASQTVTQMVVSHYDNRPHHGRDLRPLFRKHSAADSIIWIPNRPSVSEEMILGLGTDDPCRGVYFYGKFHCIVSCEKATPLTLSILERVIEQRVGNDDATLVEISPGEIELTLEFGEDDAGWEIELIREINAELKCYLIKAGNSWKWKHDTTPWPKDGLISTAEFKGQHLSISLAETLTLSAASLILTEDEENIIVSQSPETIITDEGLSLITKGALWINPIARHQGASLFGPSELIIITASYGAGVPKDDLSLVGTDGLWADVVSERLKTRGEVIGQSLGPELATLSNAKQEEIDQNRLEHVSKHIEVLSEMSIVDLKPGTYDNTESRVYKFDKPLIEHTEHLGQLSHVLDGLYHTVEEINCESIDFWDSNSMEHHNTIYGPRTGMTIKLIETNFKLRKTQKATMTQYPMYSRPVFHKKSFSEINNFAGRLGSVTIVRKFPTSRKVELCKMAAAYFVPGWREVSNQSKVNPVTFNWQDIKEWLQARPDAGRIASEVDKILSEGFEVNPINAVNVHVKLESLLKDSIADLPEQTQGRMIVWQMKGLCAMYAGGFKVLKQRLHAILRPEVIYTDGLTPQELASRFRNVTDANHIFENDMTKQDRQTDHHLIDIEFEVYAMLGGQDNFLSSWRQCHNHWKYKGKHIRGTLDGMRLTGQATTALGNAIVNMAAHAGFTLRNKERIRLMTILGDDNMAASKGKPNISTLRREIEDKYNMQSKARVSDKVGTFCSMIVYFDRDGRLELGPDFVRLKRRYEVTNGVSEATGANVDARNMSYLSMLGSMKCTEDVNEHKGYGLELRQWYDVTSSVTAASIKYQMPEEEVLGNLQSLCTMMKNSDVTIHEFEHWESIV